MGFELTEEQKMIQEAARKFVANKIDPIAKKHNREEKHSRAPRKKSLDTQ